MPQPNLLNMPKVPMQVIKDSHNMLVGFREAIREGTYHGKGLIVIAQGLMFLDQLIGQSQAQLEMAKAEEKEALRKAKEAIVNGGGKVNG